MMGLRMLDLSHLEGLCTYRYTLLHSLLLNRGHSRILIQNSSASSHSVSSYSEHTTLGAALFTSSRLAAQRREYRIEQKGMQTWGGQNRRLQYETHLFLRGGWGGRIAEHLYKHSSELSLK